MGWLWVLGNRPQLILTEGDSEAASRIQECLVFQGTTRAIRLAQKIVYAEPVIINTEEYEVKTRVGGT